MFYKSSKENKKIEQIFNVRVFDYKEIIILRKKECEFK